MKMWLYMYVQDLLLVQVASVPLLLLLLLLVLHHSTTASGAHPPA
jgi:hypothetical protein